MLFDNAHLEAGQTVLIQAGGSGIGTAAIQLAKAVGATVITTVSTEDKAAKAKALGADHVINYKEDRFEGVVRKLTKKEGVDVVFEHVGPDTFAQSMFCMKRGGILVTCGSTTGVSTEINLFQLYQRQLRLIGSFGCNLRNLATVLGKMAQGIAKPVIDTTIKLADIDSALSRLESRNVFGKDHRNPLTDGPQTPANHAAPLARQPRRHARCTLRAQRIFLSPQRRNAARRHESRPAASAGIARCAWSAGCSA